MRVKLSGRVVVTLLVVKEDAVIRLLLDVVNRLQPNIQYQVMLALTFTRLN